MAEAQDVETLKRRGRRRLVGAVALVLAAVIVLPMVFDPEPKRADVAVNVRIPGENETKFAPKVEPKAPEQKIEEKKAEPKKAVDYSTYGKNFAVTRKNRPDVGSTVSWQRVTSTVVENATPGALKLTG